MRRTLPLLLAIGCTAVAPPPRVAPPLQLKVRLADARHASPSALAVYVWPAKAPPTEAETLEPSCAWWRGEDDDFAKQGLADSTLRWGALDLTPTSIGFAGKDLVKLKNGRADEAALAPLSESLLEARRMQDAWYQACGGVLRDRPLVVADADMPSETVVQVLSLVSSLRFPRVAMMVGDREPERPAERAEGHPGHMVAVASQGQHVRVVSDHGALRAEGSLKDFESLVATALNGQTYGCTLVSTQPGGTWAETAAILDTAGAFGSRRNLLVPAIAPGKATASAPAESTTRRPTEWLALDATAGVLWLDLPTVAFSGTPDPVRCDALQGGQADVVPLSLGLEAALQTGGPAGAATMPRHLTDYGTREQGFGKAPYAGTPLVLANEMPRWAPEPEALKALEAALQACITEVSERATPTAAQVVVGLELAPSGAVEERWLASTTIPEDAVNNCIVEAWKGLPSAQPSSGNGYSLVLAPVTFGSAQPVSTTAWLSPAE